MRKTDRRGWMAIAAAVFIAAAIPAPAHPRLRKAKSGLGEILARMNDAAKHLKTVTADLDYTTVTVLVNDRSTESGRFFLRNPKNPEILIDFEKPDAKTILFKRNRAEIYYPKANRVEAYDLEHRSGLVQQFLLLGFGTDASALKGSYDVKLVGEEELDGDTTAVLELTPKGPEVASQLSKIQLWVSEDSWLPAQQQFFQPGGDYLIARYKDVQVNRDLPSSTFEIHTAPGAQRVKKS
ncbi:MAG TPA: outer membrane lipoprotein carrier protein LolA [Terriglobia bacterium]